MISAARLACSEICFNQLKRLGRCSIGNFLEDIDSGLRKIRDGVEGLIDFMSDFRDQAADHAQASGMGEFREV